MDLGAETKKTAAQLLWMEGRLPLVLAAATALAVTVCVRPFLLVLPQQYPEFLVGRITWSAANKTADYLTLFLLVAVAAATAVFANALLKAISKRCQNEQGRRAVRAVLTLLLLPVLWWGSESLVRGVSGDAPLRLYLALSILAVLLFAKLWFSHECLERTAILGIVGGSLLSAILVGFALLAIFMVPGRAWPTLLENMGLDEYRLTTANTLRLGFYATMGFSLALALLSGSLHKATRRLLLLVYILQLPLPLLVLVLRPPYWQVRSEMVPGYETSPALWVVLALSVAASIALWTRGWLQLYRKREADPPSLSNALAPSCLVYIPVFLHTGLLQQPVLSPDLYHLGEHLLPWQQWSQFGKIPFWDLSPVHGLIRVVCGLMMDVFFDGTAASLVPSQTLLTAALVALSYLSLTAITDPLTAVVMVSLMPANRTLFIFPVFFVLAHPTLLRRPLYWLACWILCSYLAVLYLVSYGSAFFLASVPMAIFMMYRQIRSHPAALARFAAGTLAVLALLGLLTPLGKITTSIPGFVLEHAKINAVAHGIPWAADKLPEAPSLLSISPWWQAVRLGWLVVALVAAALWWQELSQPKGRNRQVLWLSGTLALMGITLLSYAFGRLAPGNIYRPYESLYVFGMVLLTALLLKQRLSHKYVAIFMLCAAGAGLLHAIGGPTIGWSKAVRQPAHVIPATSEQFAFHGRQIGLPNLGRIAVSQALVDRLLALRDHLSQLLKPGEPYLDLTNNAAHYFLLDYPVPVREANLYSSPAERGQRRIIEQIIQNRPPVVLADVEGGRRRHDGGSPSLRTPLLYRHLVTLYEPIIRGRFIFLVEPERARGLATILPRAQIRIANVNNRNWKKGIHRQGHGVRLDALDVASLEVGDELVFAHSGSVKVKDRTHEAVWLSGPPLHPGRDGYPNALRVKRHGPRSREGQRLFLLDRVFQEADLESIPIAWGRSWDTLSKHVEEVAALTSGHIEELQNMRLSEDGSFTPTGGRPQAQFNFGDAVLRGREAFFLKMDFFCQAPVKAPEPRIELYWTDFSRGPNEYASVHFSAQNGTLVVPIGASPRWLLNDQLKRLKIELKNQHSCHFIRLDNITFLQPLWF